MIEYKGQLKKYDWRSHFHRNHHDKTKNRTYVDDILTFDIETTSAWINEYGSIIRYRPGKPGEYWNGLKSVSLCYIWQFSVNETVYYGRELWDFKQLLEDIPKDFSIIIWIHNLSFEFHFLQNIFKTMEVFARQPHKPMKMIPGEFPNVEFRCTYMLTRLSLETWGKSLGVKKMVGDLDYRKIRTPITPLNKKEMKYCEQDCLVVYAGIKDYVRRYGTQEAIPLTQTGTVRREVKNMLLSDPLYHKRIKKLVPYDAVQYKMLQRIFAGGYTHANRLHAGVIQEGDIEHYDFTSHYPTVMIAFKYPMSPWAYIGKKIPKKLDFENFAYIFHVRYTRIESKTFNTYIQSIKTAAYGCPYATKDCRCKWAAVKHDNGRVISAYSLEMWFTEQDYLTISETYKWDKMEILGIYRSRKDYLPKDFISYILTLYGNKTTLKNVTDEERPGAPDLYAQSKQYLNSLFGMAVTALMQADVVYNDTDKSWEIGKLTAEQVNERLDELRQWSRRERRYFLSYSWGCWVTAYARRMLWRCLLDAGDRDVLYADTDSLFVLGHHDFSKYNIWIAGEIEKTLLHYNIDPEKARPKDPKGIKRQLGLFLKEENDTHFVTLGAKRYLERREDGKLYLTVAGINKDAVYCLHDDMEAFRDGFIFDKDFGSVHKSLLTYVYEQPDLIFPDGYKSTYRYGICLRPNGYHLHMTDEYKKLINYDRLNLTSLPDAFKNHLRGRFKL